MEFDGTTAGERAATEARKPRRDDVIEVRVGDFDARGRMSATCGEFHVRLRRGIPGETVRARVVRRQRAIVDAVAIETIAASPHAVPAHCPHARSCGGCSFQGLAYEQQLVGKHRLVRAAFASRPSLAGTAVDDVLAAPEAFGYRNKMEFSFGSRRWIEPGEPEGVESGFALGLHVANFFHKVLDVRTCSIQSPAADAILAAAREIAVRLGLSPWDARAHVGLLRYLVLRVARSTGEILVGLVTSADAHEEVDAFARELLARDLGITTFVQGVNSRAADTAAAERERVIFGPGSIRERLGDLVFEISLSSFFQTNTRAAEVLIRLVREEAALRGDEIVWDLYCGTGTLGLSLAGSVRAVVGCEITPAAVADARRNAAANGIENATFVEGDVLASLAGAASNVSPPDLVLLDPPRAGLHPDLLPVLLAAAPKRIVYVSCNPNAAAADVERLVAGGYRLGRVRPIDLFPHTPHVECVIGLSRDVG